MWVVIQYVICNLIDFWMRFLNEPSLQLSFYKRSRWTFELLKLEHAYIVQQKLYFKRTSTNHFFCDITSLNGLRRKQAHERIVLIPDSGLEQFCWRCNPACRCDRVFLTQLRFYFLVSSNLMEKKSKVLCRIFSSWQEEKIYIYIQYLYITIFLNTISSIIPKSQLLAVL